MTGRVQTIEFDNGRAEVFGSWTHVYTGGEFPVVSYLPAYDQWRPFDAEYDKTTLRQITSVGRDGAAARVGGTISLIMQIEAASKAALDDAASKLARLAEQDRRQWRAMTQEERDAINEYALKTEGHTID